MAHARRLDVAGLDIDADILQIRQERHDSGQPAAKVQQALARFGADIIVDY